MPTKSGIAGKGDWTQSNCAGGFSAGESCTVQYSGEYFLGGTTPATLVVKATTASGTVLATQTYAAPNGGHRYGARLTFTIPADTQEVDMSAVLQDANGSVIATTVVQAYHAS
jgi:hypothetical protein